MQRLMACWALATLLLTGCASAPFDSSTATGTGTETQEHATTGRAASVVLQNALPAPVHKVLWANGSVAPQDTCNTGGCLMDSRAFRVTDISSDLPTGVPVQVTLELTFEALATTGTLGGGFVAWVRSEDTTFYSYDVDWEPGHMLVRTVLRPAGIVEVVLAAFDPGRGVPETPYTLRIAVDADPYLLPPGVPVAVTLGPTVSITAIANGKPTPFLLYSPTDAFLGRFEASHRLPDDAPQGQYVALLPEGSPAAHLTSDGAATRLAALGFEVEYGPPGPLPPHGAYDATWEVSKMPLAVGILARTVATDLGPEPLVSTGFTLRLTGPNGLVVTSPQVCAVCLNFGGNWFEWDSAVGDERLAPGTYAVHAETDASYGLEIMPVGYFIERSA